MFPFVKDDLNGSILQGQPCSNDLSWVIFHQEEYEMEKSARARLRSLRLDMAGGAGEGRKTLF